MKRRIANIFCCGTACLIIGLLVNVAAAQSDNHDAHAHHNYAAPKADADSIDFFTNYGNYMPRTHCLLTEEGKPDWPWIITLIVLNVGVVLSYARIFTFWTRAYFQEEPADRNKKLFNLANIFLWCGICGYALSIAIFFWPAYRLLAICLAVLNYFSWRFLHNVDDFKLALASKRPTARPTYCSRRSTTSSTFPRSKPAKWSWKKSTSMSPISSMKSPPSSPAIHAKRISN